MSYDNDKPLGPWPAKRQSSKGLPIRILLYIGFALFLASTGNIALALLVGGIAVLATGSDLLQSRNNPSLIFALILLAGFLGVFWVLGGMAAGG